MVKGIFNKVTATVNLYRRISKLASEEDVDLTAIFTLLKCEGCVKIILKREADSAYLLIFQQGKPDPDYTIKVR